MDFRQKISKEICESKYFLHNESSLENLLWDVATEVASKENAKEHWRDEFYFSMKDGEFIPGGRILANARPHSKMKNYNNCFTIDVEDSMDGITTAIKEYMTIQSIGGGVGFNISKLRPKNAKISKGGESSGPLSFLEIFDSASKTIKVGGSRRAASIAILNIDHPDIEEFIIFKQGDTNKKLTQFNISVGITDAFIDAVNNDKDWELVFEGKIYKTIKAKELYNTLLKQAWWYNEPGVLFLDTIEENNNGHHAFQVDRCNP